MIGSNTRQTNVDEHDHGAARSAAFQPVMGRAVDLESVRRSTDAGCARCTAWRSARVFQYPAWISHWRSVPVLTANARERARYSTEEGRTKAGVAFGREGQHPIARDVGITTVARAPASLRAQPCSRFTCPSNVSAARACRMRPAATSAITPARSASRCDIPTSASTSTPRKRRHW